MSGNNNLSQDILQSCDFFNDGSGLGLWEFNSSTSDVCGLNDLVFEGIEKYSSGIINYSAAALIASDNYIHSQNPLSPTNGNFTYSFWINRTEQRTEYESIISEYLADEPQRTIIAVYNNTLQIYYGSMGWIDTGFSIDLDKWYHIVVSSDNGLGKTTIYVDKNEIYSFDSQIILPGLNTYIGATEYHLDNSNKFYGKIDHFRIFDRPVTSNEVVALYEESPDTQSSGDIILGDGSIAIEDFKIGDGITDLVEEIYIGTKKVWPAGTKPSWEYGNANFNASDDLHEEIQFTWDEALGTKPIYYDIYKDDALLVQDVQSGYSYYRSAGTAIYYVKARNIAGWVNSETDSGTALGAPEAPTFDPDTFLASNTRTDGIECTWQEALGTEPIKYDLVIENSITLATDISSPYLWTDGGETSPEPDTEYNLQVRAYNDYGETFSRVDVGEMITATTPPVFPDDALRASDNEERGKIFVRWEPATGAHPDPEYFVFEGETETGDFYVINSDNPIPHNPDTTEYEYTVTKNNGGSYWYFVRASNDSTIDITVKDTGTDDTNKDQGSCEAVLDPINILLFSVSANGLTANIS